MHLPFANLGSKFQSDSFEVETLYLQHTFARVSLILRKPRLSILTLPCYVSPMKLDSPSSIKCSSNLKELWRRKMDKGKSSAFPRQ